MEISGQQSPAEVGGYGTTTTFDAQKVSMMIPIAWILYSLFYQKIHVFSWQGVQLIFLITS